MKKTTLAATLAALAFPLAASAKAEENAVAFSLIEELGSLEGADLIIFIGAAIIFAALTVALIVLMKKGNTPEATTKKRIPPLRGVVFGGMCLALSFALSYIKIFRMPFGGAVTLCSMLPIMMYGIWAGPYYGFGAAFAYGLLQMIQGVEFYHPVQFALDYILAFTALGIASLFSEKKTAPLGILVAGFARMLCSVVSGAVFFGQWAPEGMNPWAYSLIYNALSIGVDTVICFVIYIIPPVRNTFGKLGDIVRG